MWSKHLRVRTAYWNEDERVWNWVYRFIGGWEEDFKDRDIIYISWLGGDEEWSACISRMGIKIYIKEKDLEVIKIKSLMRAKELGWKIKELKI